MCSQSTIWATALNSTSDIVRDSQGVERLEDRRLEGSALGEALADFLRQSGDLLVQRFAVVRDCFRPDVAAGVSTRWCSRSVSSVAEAQKPGTSSYG